MYKALIACTFSFLFAFSTFATEIPFTDETELFTHFWEETDDAIVLTINLQEGLTFIPNYFTCKPAAGFSFLRGDGYRLQWIGFQFPRQ
jgi:hypothetical protein